MRGHVLVSRSWRLRRHLRAVEHLSSLASRPGRRRTSADDRAQEVGAGSPSKGLACPNWGLSPVFEARENDVSRNRHPKRIIADEGDLNEDPDDCKPRENKREDEYKIDSQCLAPRGPRRTPDGLFIERIREQPGARKSSRKRHPPTTVEPTE